MIEAGDDRPEANAARHLLRYLLRYLWPAPWFLDEPKKINNLPKTCGGCSLAKAPL
jgi:hypothetical protein